MDLNSKKDKKSTGRKPDRFGFKLGVVFGVTLVSVTVLLFSWNLVLSAFSDRKSEDPRIVTSSGADPKLESDLVAALEFDEVPEVERVTDPFVDRQGLAREVVAQGPSSNPQNVGANSMPLPQQTAGAAVGSEEKPDPIEETKARWTKRMEDLRLGRAVPPESEIFDVVDLYPLAFAKGGRGPDEIIFFSMALGRNVSFSVGSRLHNGTISAVSEAGVRFLVNGNPRSAITRGWGRPATTKVKGEKED
jgi:hypothetical protein